MQKETTIGQLVFVKVKSVTRPILKMDGSKAVYFTVQSNIEASKQIANGRTKKGADGSELPPPNVMDVVNLETGEEATIVVNTVLGSNLTEKYPDDAYVGKSFEVLKFAPEGNKRYATFQITEIALKAAEPKAGSVISKK